MSLIHVVVLVIALAQANGGHDRPANAGVIKVGDVVNGEVTTDSPVVRTPTLDKRYTDAPVRGVAYRLSIERSSPVTVELRSYFFDAYLVVRDASGNTIAEDDNGLLRTHARIVVKPAASATFEVVASALHGGIGPFELRVVGDTPTVFDPSGKQAAELEDARRAVQIVEARRGPEHADTAARLNDVAELLFAQGQYDEARQHFARALAIREKALGPEHLATATSLNNLATVLYLQSKLEEARPLFERALAIHEKVLGPGHRDTATSLNSLATLLGSEGKFEEARQLLERAVAIREKVLGPEHRDTASSLGNLAAMLRSLGKYEEARPLFERALAIDEKVLGPEHRDTATCLCNLSELLRSLGEYDRARPLCERALAIYEKTVGPDHPFTATSLNNLAVLLQLQGKYDEARPLFERALAIREKVLGPDHQDTAGCLDNFGLLLKCQGKYEAARPLFERALAIREKALGPDHPDTAMTVNNLATVLEDECRYEEARPLFERAFAILEKTLGSSHPSVAASLSNLAGLLNHEGKYEEARPLLERALAINMKALGPEHPDTVLSLSNLAVLLDSEGKHDEARPLYESALAIKTKVLGPEHPETAVGLNNLAVLLAFQRKYDEARPLYERALAIREKVAGPEHPDTALSLRNFAMMLESQGMYAEARQQFERALAIRQKQLGSAHPDTAESLTNLALNELDLRDSDHALERARELMKSICRYIFDEAAQASTSDALLAFASVHDAAETLLSATAPSERRSDLLYANMLLAKGAAFHLTRQRRHSLAEHSDATTRAVLERLQVVRATMSNLFSASATKDRSELEREIERWRQEREDCETKLARITATRPDLQPTAPAEVRAALPKNAALLDFFEHRLYEPAEWKEGNVVKLGRWSSRRFSVWISRRESTSQEWLDLGPSAAIEQAIGDYLDGVVGVRGVGVVTTRAESEVRVKRLRELLWDPIAAHLGDGSGQDAVQHVIIAADGALATLPFGLIVDASGRYLIEKYAFSQIEDASLLARPSQVAGGEQGGDVQGAAISPSTPPVPSLLVAGAINYDEGRRLEAGLAATTERRGDFTFAWDPLKFTGGEADGVATRHHRRFGDAPSLLLLEDAPTEERLKTEMPRYSVLHLATHGYFLVDGLKSITDVLDDPRERELLDSPEHRFVAGYWPQFLCGVVCAGANHPQPDRDNGLLTGDEVSGLDLSHCDLVVLSACKSALGKRQAGEGLLSLTRSFREAGARTVMSSLWNVRDDSTMELMLDFYDRLWNKDESKLDALRHAQLDMLEQNRKKYGGAAKPIQWGAFVLTGDVQ